LVIHNNGEVNNQMNTSGLGLQNMRQRTETFDGMFKINTDDGFRLEARFPI
jgi:signal transduction histidine kinase